MKSIQTAQINKWHRPYYMFRSLSPYKSFKHISSLYLSLLFSEWHVINVSYKLPEVCSLVIEIRSNPKCHSLNCVWLQCCVNLREHCNRAWWAKKIKINYYRLMVQKLFVNRSHSILCNCSSQAKTSSYFCRKCALGDF
jgi:hypothetical protein